MTPLRRAAFLAAACACLPLAASAGPNVESAPRAGGPSIQAMAESVTTFFGPQNANPMPIDMNLVLGALQKVGKADGPTREQMQPVIDRIQLAADSFAPVEPSEQEPAPGLASSVKLELLAGPLRAWLNAGQKESISKKQAEYGAKLTSQDRQRLQAKMMAWAHALGGAALGADLAGSAVAVDARGAGSPTSPAGARLARYAPESRQASPSPRPPLAGQSRAITAEQLPGRYIFKVEAPDSHDFTVEMTISRDGGFKTRNGFNGAYDPQSGLSGRWKLENGKLIGTSPTSFGDQTTEVDFSALSAEELKPGAIVPIRTEHGGQSVVYPFRIATIDTRAADLTRNIVVGSALGLAGVTGIAAVFGGSIVAFIALITALKVGAGLIVAFWGYRALRRAPDPQAQFLSALGRPAAWLTILIGVGFSVLSIGEAFGFFH